MKHKGMLSRNPQAAWQQVEDNVVVVTPHTRKIHILSGVGSMVWDLLDVPHCQEDLITAVLEEYEVETTKAQTDIAVFVDDLLEKEIINQHD
jgi:hypothetical protein